MADAERLNWIALSTIGLLILFAVFAVAWQQPPAAALADAPATEFSAERALLHLRRIAREPHPVGSSAHGRVRDYILNALGTLGVPAAVQRRTAVVQRADAVVAADLENIAARLEGTGRGGALLLMGHYDSTPAGPGASDDGHAVAAILEVVRALRAGPPLKNDVILLFTDGEELGLLGAQVFAAEHPWAKEVALALNFEARGNRGPAVMFETSSRNGDLIAQFARAAPRPVANSLSAAIYEWMPNDTDLSVFKARGYAGLNFAYIEGLTHYHTKLDSVEEIDLRSVQHQGANALALARQFATAQLPPPESPDACYFNLGPSILVHYPASWSLLFAIGAWALFAAGLFFAFRRRSLTALGVMAGALIVVLALLTGGGLATLVGFVLQRLRDPSKNLYAGRYFFAAVVSGAVCWSSIAYAAAGRRIGADNLLGGSLLVWALLALGTALALPGGSYLFVWPLAASAAAILYTNHPRAGARARLIAVALAAVPGFFLFAPLIYQMFEALAFSGIGLTAALVVLVFGLAAPSFAALTGAARLGMSLIAAAAGVAFLIPGFAVDFDERRPRPDSLHYLLKSDRGEALWVSADHKTDWWTEQFLSRTPEKAAVPELSLLSSLPMFTHRAPALDIAGPAVQMLEDLPGAEFRTVRLRILNQGRAPSITFMVDLAAEPKLVELNENPPRPAEMRARTARARRVPSEWQLLYRNPPATFDLTLRTKKRTPLQGRIVAEYFGLPGMPNFPARPPDTMPGDRWGDSTWVSKTFVLKDDR